MALKDKLEKHHHDAVAEQVFKESQTALPTLGWVAKAKAVEVQWLDLEGKDMGCNRVELPASFEDLHAKITLHSDELYRQMMLENAKAVLKL